MDCTTPLTEKICGWAVSLAAGGSDLADGTPNRINIHKPNGNALVNNRHTLMFSVHNSCHRTAN
jgi:hypothetical protein